MTERQARTTANLVMAAAAVGAAYYVLRTPPLRRTVWQLARRWAAGPLVVWLASEVRGAWDESGSPAVLTPGRSGATSRVPVSR